MAFAKSRYLDQPGLDQGIFWRRDFLLLDVGRPKSHLPWRNFADQNSSFPAVSEIKAFLQRAVLSRAGASLGAFGGWTCRRARLQLPWRRLSVTGAWDGLLVEKTVA